MSLWHDLKQEMQSLTGWLAWAERSRQSHDHDEPLYLLRRLRPWRIWSPSTWLLDVIVFVLELRRVVGFRRYFLPSWWRDREKRRAWRRQHPTRWRRDWDHLMKLERARMARIEAVADREQEAKKRC